MPASARIGGDEEAVSRREGEEGADMPGGGRVGVDDIADDERPVRLQNAMDALQQGLELLGARDIG